MYTSTLFIFNSKSNSPPPALTGNSDSQFLMCWNDTFIYFWIFSLHMWIPWTRIVKHSMTRHLEATGWCMCCGNCTISPPFSRNPWKFIVVQLLLLDHKSRANIYIQLLRPSTGYACIPVLVFVLKQCRIYL